MSAEPGNGPLSPACLWSIIIVHYGDPAALKACLQATAKQSDGDIEIIVVDNSDADGRGAALARELEVRVLKPGRNLGYGAGGNLAAAGARGRYLLFLNPDVVPAPGMLAELTRSMGRLPPLALISPTLLLPDGRVNAHGNDVTYTGITTCRDLGAIHRRRALSPVTAVSGAALAVRREDFECLGGFDEHFFLYLEDTDLSLRAWLRGGSCWCDSRALAIHDYRWRFTVAKQFELEKNRLQLLVKIFRRRTLLALGPGLLLAEICTIGHAIFCGPAYLRAKLHGYHAIVADWGALMGRRRSVQETRRIGDAEVLGRCSWRLPMRQQAGVVPGAILEWLVAPLLLGPYAVTRILAAWLHW